MVTVPLPIPEDPGLREIGQGPTQLQPVDPPPLLAGGFHFHLEIRRHGDTSPLSLVSRGF